MLDLRPYLRVAGDREPRTLGVVRFRAFICSFECTFCAECTAQLGGVCPNCGPRARAPFQLRPAQFSSRADPASSMRACASFDGCPPQKRRRA
jgi:hypothetical protein